MKRLALVVMLCTLPACGVVDLFLQPSGSEQPVDNPDGTQRVETVADRMGEAVATVAGAGTGNPLLGYGLLALLRGVIGWGVERRKDQLAVLAASKLPPPAS